MNPWLLHEVRKDDINAKYREADRHRLVAQIKPDSNGRRHRSPSVWLARRAMTLASWVESQAEAMRLALARLAGE